MRTFKENLFTFGYNKKALIKSAIENYDLDSSSNYEFIVRAKDMMDSQSIPVKNRKIKGAYYEDL